MSDLLKSLFKDPYRTYVISDKGRYNITSHFKNLSKLSESKEVEYQGHIFKIIDKKEKYLPLSILRILDIALALILTILSVGTLPYFSQTVCDMFTGRAVVIYMNANSSVLNILKYCPTTKIQDEKLLKVIDQVSPILDDFTSQMKIEDQVKAHEGAKEFLKTELEKLGAKVEFISPPSEAETPKLDPSLKFTELLNPKVFTYQITSGVQKDIIKDGQRTEDNIVIYGVASQFNGCESPEPCTIPPKHALAIYKSDSTQGPNAQLAFSAEQVELINCGGNLGYNGLCKVLDENTKDEIEHGYFIPSKDKGTALVALLKEKGHLIEYPCIGNKPKDGTKDVYQILVAAPAFGLYAEQKNSATGEELKNIQFLSALHSFRAQFKQCIKLAEEIKKPVKFKPTAVGLGVFNNNPKTVALAFYQAALEYQTLLKDHNVEVIFQHFMKKGDIAHLLSLEEYK